jgi:O-antigen/teichoic acid export membrane protein
MINLKNSLINNAINQLFSFFSFFIFQIIVSRILLPYDFGLVNLFFSIYVIIVLVFSSGVSGRIINFEDNQFTLTKHLIKKYNYLNTIIGSLLIFIIIILFIAIEINYNFYILTISFYLIFSFKIQVIILESIYQKKLKFDVLKKVGLLSSLLSVLIPLLFLFFNFGYYVLVFHYFIQVFSQYICLRSNSLFKEITKRTSVENYEPKTNEMLFSKDNYFSSVIFYLTRYIDNWFITLKWGFNTSGFYSRSIVVIKSPMELFTSFLRPIINPYLSATKASDNNLVEIEFFIKYISIFFAFIMLIGNIILFAFSEYIIVLLFGQDWIPASVFVKFLSFSLFPNAMVSIITPIFFSNKNSRPILISSIIKLISLVMLFTFSIIIDNILFFTISYSLSLLIINLFLTALIVKYYFPTLKEIFYKINVLYFIIFTLLLANFFISNDIFFTLFISISILSILLIPYLYRNFNKFYLLIEKDIAF